MVKTLFSIRSILRDAKRYSYIFFNWITWSCVNGSIVRIKLCICRTSSSANKLFSHSCDPLSNLSSVSNKAFCVQRSSADVISKTMSFYNRMQTANGFKLD